MSGRTPLVDPARFPILARAVNGRRLVYLDNAATTQKPDSVIEATEAYYSTENANINRSAHALSHASTRRYEESRARLALHLGVSAEEIIFTKGCTEAINLAARSWGDSVLRPGDRVLLPENEHHANIVPWQMAAERTGAVVQPIPIRDDCRVDLDALALMLAEGGVRLLGVKQICNATGIVNPVAEIGEMARRHGALVLVDGAQGLAHLSGSPAELPIDFYAMSGHKAYGPMGVGALWVRGEVLASMPPFLGGGDMIRHVSFEKTTFADGPQRFEAGTPNVAGAAGLACALDFLAELEPGSLDAHEASLREEAEEALRGIPGITIIGAGSPKAGIVSFVLEGVHPHDLATILDRQGVAVRTGHHCCQPLMRRLGLPATVRASFAAYNGSDDIAVLAEAVERGRRIFADA
ncbi:MAG: SufS family cysteine desulfurase [Fimbriimonadaceae bacterium]|nr:SufS family cysteine desulfurase [Fimbriimonadaceae bacterium]